METNEPKCPDNLELSGYRKDPILGKLRSPEWWISYKYATKKQRDRLLTAPPCDQIPKEFDRIVKTQTELKKIEDRQDLICKVAFIPVYIVVCLTIFILSFFGFTVRNSLLEKDV